MNLRTFPWIRSREAAGGLTLSGCWFDIALGELWALGHGDGPPSGVMIIKSRAVQGLPLAVLVLLLTQTLLALLLLCHASRSTLRRA